MPLAAPAFALWYPRELSKWFLAGARHGRFLPACKTDDSQGLKPLQSRKISVCGCQGGRVLLSRCGLNVVQRLDMQL